MSSRLRPSTPLARRRSRLGAASTMTLAAALLALCVGPASAQAPSPGAAKPGAPVPSPAATKAAAATGKNPVVVIATSLGDITVELYADKAPKSVENFLKYANNKFYDGTVFHRVIKNFMIQGGGFTPEMVQKPTDPPIKNEANNGLKNDAGTLAMARTSVPDSATSQFFINAVDNHRLDFTAETPTGWGYTVFGKVTGGMDVVKKIEAVQTGSKGMYQDVPTEPVVIRSVTVKS